MATDLTTTLADQAPWATARVALNATAADVEAVTLPLWCGRLTVRFKQNDTSTDDSGFLSYTGSDGGAMGTDRFPISSGQSISFAVRTKEMVSGTKGRQQVYLTASTNTAFAYLILEEEVQGA
jgi:hypothetical protein